ncbi:MAG: PPC domain-containing protein [Verrucomicrobia bacterium]|nr:PPC domain-containing protein [Verrucomicrobiota bacterium]
MNFRIGGHFLHGEAGFEMLGAGIMASTRVRETNTVWFEGPIVPLPGSQQTENYPRDHAGSVRIAADAATGARCWRVWTSQGATPAMKFIVGDLPEITEQEMDGAPIPVEVKPPVTINGRIYPRENVDVWTFAARAGQEFTCSVAALSLGSPLQARLVVLDQVGRQIAEALASQRGDPQLHFKAATDGTYSVRIHDISFGGLQHFVYRLTITSEPVVNSIFPLGARRGGAVKLELNGNALPSRTVELKIPADAPKNYQTPLTLAGKRTNPVLLEVDDLPEFTHSLGDVMFATPAMLNGRIASPGETNSWSFAAKKGELLELTLAAARLGSPLTPVLAVTDAQGKQLARGEANVGDTSDTTLQFKAPDDGTYIIRVSEHFLSRGGPDFAYRLRVAPPDAPDFQLTLVSDALNVLRDLPEGLAPATAVKSKPRQKPGQFKLNVAALGGFAGEIELTVDGLPPGVTVLNTKITAKKATHDLSFTAEPTAKIGASRITIHGAATINGQLVIRTATLPLKRGEPPLDSALLAVSLPTPFKHSAEYLFTLGPRGSVFHRPYHLDRGGFTGPITARLADRQGRHLQGVTGATVIVPPDADEFDYAVTLPPWMEIGRTSRAQVMTSGVIKDFDGSEHIVSYTSNDQNDQVIVVTSAGLLNVEAEHHTLVVAPGKSVELKVRVHREKSIESAPVRVELAVPSHIKGVQAVPVVLPAGKDEATLRVQFAADAGPFNMPLTLHATSLDPQNPHFAEAKVEFIQSADASRKISAR